MNEKAVSAIIGVILMVAITVAIATTVFILVSHEDGDVEEQNDEDNGTTLSDDDDNSEVFYVEGWVIDAYKSGAYKEIGGKDHSIWHLSLGANYDTEIEDTTFYSMVFLDGVSAPPEDVHLRFYHGEYDETTLLVHKVKSL